VLLRVNAGQATAHARALLARLCRQVYHWWVLGRGTGGREQKGLPHHRLVERVEGNKGQAEELVHHRSVRGRGVCLVVWVLTFLLCPERRRRASCCAT
jgi:hypothetical protein